MKTFESLPQFYNSEDWKRCRGTIMNDRQNKTDGVLYCEECGKALIHNYEAIGHHKKPLTTQNMNDASVSLNPDNIEIVCGKCHNEIHSRFGYQTERKVYIVYGAPCSGKTTYVNENKGNSDIVVDIDNIWEALTGDRYRKPDAIKKNVFQVRDCLLDMIKRRFPYSGGWERAWIVEGLPFKGQRDDKCALFGAELVFIDATKETCKKRLINDEGRRPYAKEWERYIDEWFDKYQE